MPIVHFFRNNMIVPVDYNDQEGILSCMFKSIFEVKRGYIYYHKKNDDQEYPQTERVFAYEFYRKWATNVENDFLNYIVNGEPEKNVSKFRNAHHQYPDLVLHHSQGDYDNQGAVCELKRKEGFTPYNFRNDIEKLFYFVCNKKCKYRFQFGVFILVGAKMDTIIRAISTTSKELLKYNKNNIELKKIICVTYDGEEIETCQLWEIINYTTEQINEIIEKYKNYNR